MVNIFPPTPMIWPSDLCSIAGDTIAFAKPVIGTREPAPANLANLLYKCREVKRAPKNIKIIAVMVELVSESNPLNLQTSNIN